MADANGIIFKNPTLNLWFVGPTVDLTAWNVVTVSGCPDAAFNLDYAYVPATAKWTNGIRNIWKDTLWYMSDGTITYLAPDNGLSIPPATFTNPASDIENSHVEVDGYVLPFTIMNNDRPSFELNDEKFITCYFLPSWVVFGDAGSHTNSSTSFVPPLTNWRDAQGGASNLNIQFFPSPTPSTAILSGGAATWVSTNPTTGFVSLTDTPDEDFGYVISFDVQQGVAYPYYKYCTKTAGEVYGTLPEAVRANYIFAGWYTDPDGQGTRILATTELVAAEDATLYAKWVSYVSGKVGCGACLVSLFVLGIGTDLFCEYIGSRLAKTTPQTIIRKLPKP